MTPRTIAEAFELAPGTATVGLERTLADRVTAELHRMILRGDFAAGEALRIQDLAALFDTSSMPVREALRRLAALGLVDLVPHRGARVMELSRADLEDTFRTRLALEPLVTAAAADRFTQERYLRAKNALDRHEAMLLAGDVDRARLAHTEFHFTIYQGSGSRWLLLAIEPVWQNTERYRFASSQPSTAERSHREHVEILEACEQHDPARAEEATRLHLQGAMDRMLSALSPNNADPTGSTAPERTPTTP
jgi:DNA-binding GntR family transcriptional regulator